MKLPSPRGFSAVCPSAAVCEHVANFSARGLRAPVPEELSLADFHGLARQPYVRTGAKPKAIEARATWSVERPEPKKIPMSFSPPRFKQTKRGPREVKWLLCLETVRVRITLPLGSYDLTATSRGNSVLDSRNGSRRLPCQVRCDLERIMPPQEASAAVAELASVFAH